VHIANDDHDHAPQPVSVSVCVAGLTRVDDCDYLSADEDESDGDATDDKHGDMEMFNLITHVCSSDVKLMSSNLSKDLSFTQAQSQELVGSLARRAGAAEAPLFSVFDLSFACVQEYVDLLCRLRPPRCCGKPPPMPSVEQFASRFVLRGCKN
jgi:hypothetical protein